MIQNQNPEEEITTNYLSTIPPHQDDGKSRLDSVDFAGLFQNRVTNNGPSVQQSGTVEEAKILETSMDEYDVKHLQDSALE